MDEEINHILQLIARARSAWDQYNIQLALPVERDWIQQGHPWDAFNNGRRAAQARRDPAAIGRAWNRLQESLVELSDTAERVRGRAAPGEFSAPPMLPEDRRVGAFSRAAIPEDVQGAIPGAPIAEVGVPAREPYAGEPVLVG